MSVPLIRSIEIGIYALTNLPFDSSQSGVQLSRAGAEVLKVKSRRLRQCWREAIIADVRAENLIVEHL